MQEEKVLLKKEVGSFKVEFKHIKRENYKINKRHKQINNKYFDSEEETIVTVTEEKVFTKCDFCLYWGYFNVKHIKQGSDV